MTMRVRKLVADRGNTIIQLDAGEKAKWIEATKPVYSAWVEQVRPKGLDGQKLIETAKAFVAKHEKA